MTYRGMLPFFPAANLQLQPHVDAVVVLENIDQGKKKKRAAEGSLEETSLSDTGLAAAEKPERKKRLRLEQIRVLEKSFEMGRKLEPGRKAELARALGLSPRQVAIWFQNRRARWKNKRTEEEFDELKRHLVAIREENAELQAENQRLLAELNEIRSIDRIVSDKGKDPACEPINLNKGPATFPELLFGGGGPSRPEDGGGLCGMLDVEQSAFWVWPEHGKFHHPAH